MAASSATLKADIIAYAQSLGFGRVGVTTADRLESAERSLREWVEDGRAGEMAYMETGWSSRARPQDRLPGARSVIVLAMNYFNGDPLPEPGEGRVARYAWGKDYHRVVEKRLAALERYIQALVAEACTRSYIDTGPLLERALAQRAGLGFIGKNTMLITRGLGSWVFLACVLTTIELPSDTPDARSCGDCTLCVDACPTQALTEPYHLDARRCISYLTIESKSPVSAELGGLMGEWLFGCDICQEVCPHNTRVPITPIVEFQPSMGVGPTINLSEVLSLQNDDDFNARFAGTPLKRAKRQGLQRNARAVAKNQSI